MRALSRVLFALLLVGLHACAPFHETAGDMCNDPTQNYTASSEYECE